MNEPGFISLAQLYDCHRAGIEAHGGSHGLLSEGAAESACNAAKNCFLYEAFELEEPPGIALIAACYWFNVCQAHAFIDGNKRAAVICFSSFLTRNGYTTSLSETEVESITFSIARGELRRNQVALRIAASLKPLP